MATQRSAPGLSQLPVPRGIGPLAIVGALVVWLLYSALFTVPAESVGVIQCFGHYHSEV